MLVISLDRGHNKSEMWSTRPSGCRSASSHHCVPRAQKNDLSNARLSRVGKALRLHRYIVHRAKSMLMTCRVKTLMRWLCPASPKMVRPARPKRFVRSCDNAEIWVVWRTFAEISRCCVKQPKGFALEGTPTIGKCKAMREQGQSAFQSHDWVKIWCGSNCMVSVIVPSYNTARYIGETLDSVFAQTYKNYEVIVINDGSPDTFQLERVLERYSDRIRYIKQENRGPSGARNTGIKQARGDFLAFPDSDDVWLPDFLSEQLKFFDENPTIDLVCADCTFFGNTDLEGKSWQSVAPVHGPVTLETILPTHGGAFLSFLLLRKNIVSKVGFFDEELRLLEDYNYWLRLLYHGGKWAYLPKVLGSRRVHGESLTHNKDVVVPHAILALQRFATILDPRGREALLVRTEIARCRSRLAVGEGKRRLALSDYEAAGHCFSEANAAMPSRELQLALLGLRWAPRLTGWIISRRDKRLRRRSPTSRIAASKSQT
jgi:glycosyltransferase involved in cell wall biosynthesis